MVISLERSADLHTAQLMPLPLTVACFSKIQIGLTFLVLAHPGSPEQRAVKQVCKVSKSKVYRYSSSQSNLPHRYGDSHAIQDHTVLPATRQR